jgi:hypothetical protein
MRVALAIFLAAGAAYGTWNSVHVAEVFYAPTSTSAPLFIELYNSSLTDVSLKGGEIRVYAASGVCSAAFPDDAVVPGYGFYLIGRDEDRPAWANRTYQPDLYTTWEEGFATAKGGVALITPDNAVRDAVGWGSVALPFYEGVAHPPVAAGHSLERKSGAVHNEIRGNSYDTANNSHDVRDRATPEPQNTYSPKETPDASTEADAWGRIKAMYYGQR